MMPFAVAARLQYRYGSYYTVWLCSPEGEREYLGFTARKSGRGLLAVLGRDSAQERIRQFNDADELRLDLHSDHLSISNGWVVRFGGTIRQEAADSHV